jgi:hypothetical protein
MGPIVCHTSSSPGCALVMAGLVGCQIGKRFLSSHSEKILNQFTKQAAPFASADPIRAADLLHLITEAGNVSSSTSVLDVACGPGILACAMASHAVSSYFVSISHSRNWFMVWIWSLLCLIRRKNYKQPTSSQIFSGVLGMSTSSLSMITRSIQ